MLHIQKTSKERHIEIQKMTRITKDIYYLFLKHGSELLWVDDPLRHERPKGTTKETDKMFIILEKIDENLQLFYNGHYSDRMIKGFEAEIEKYKSKLTIEVYEIMVNNYKI